MKTFLYFTFIAGVLILCCYLQDSIGEEEKAKLLPFYPNIAIDLSYSEKWPEEKWKIVRRGLKKKEVRKVKD